MNKFKLIIIFFLLLFCSYFSKGEIVQFGHNEGKNDTASLNILFNLTGLVTSPVLVAFIAYKNNTSDRVTGVTWRGTETFTKFNSDQNGDANCEIWYLEAPSTANSTVVVSLAASSRILASVVSYSGVDQTTPFRIASSTTSNGTNDAPTVGVTTLADEMAVDVISQVSAGPDTATESQTRVFVDAATGGGTDVRGAGQYVLSTGGTETMSWSMSGSDNWALCAGALQEGQAVRRRTDRGGYYGTRR